MGNKPPKGGKGSKGYPSPGSPPGSPQGRYAPGDFDPIRPPQSVGPVAAVAPDTIPRTSCWVDDVSYDLWKTSGGQHGVAGRGVGERYENGVWQVVHPALLVEGHRAVLGQQGVTDTYGHYGMLWSSALRHGTAFGVRITAAELRSLNEGNFMVGLTPSSSFDPMRRPGSSSWLPTLLAASYGTVSVQGEQRNYTPWQGRSVEVGFIIRCGSRQGRVNASMYINGECVVDTLEMKLPHDTLHLFVFLNFVDDQAVLLPNWQPPPSFAAMPPGKGRGPPMGKGGKPSKGGKGGKGTKGGKKPGYGPPPGYY